MIWLTDCADGFAAPLYVRIVCLSILSRLITPSVKARRVANHYGGGTERLLMKILRSRKLAAQNYFAEEYSLLNVLL